MVVVGATLLLGQSASADELRVAVASNFTPTLSTLAKVYQEQSGHVVTIIPGSTGKLYAQIRHGAPFDAFFAADTERPAALEQDGLCVPGTRFTYARGTLVLWTTKAGVADVSAALHADQPQRIAIANPQLAPYGRAAFEVLGAMQLWDALSPRLVRGENIAQTLQFVHSGNAALGFVSRAQITQLPMSARGSVWLVPDDLYTPIEQQAVLLRDTPAGRELLLFVTSTAALQILQADGYDTP
jgi:molybdate transport system substrate-binding protein